ncbi:Phosphotyrosyl phosphatase activator [Fomitiporia mediterranea MF3/22]|uniref:Phosphotyrosyl phosphatase activator n=1 Tax=Fomitiporia mediterranea (strain MF3/22) TaxID=694068 RepID=UPI0004407EFD|nr:Phosphotyrosyl phosphatase activator [Fomitiporia mediterranea MF3/22]EJD06787.1 Phosphotyrosyl phosphatase activator [Fomitiporia mediterranea MF3/22]
MASANYPLPPEVRNDVAARLHAPSLRIRFDEDVDAWKSTKGYQNYLLFLHRLSESVVGYNMPECAAENPSTSMSSAVRSTLDILDKLDRWIDEIPPLPTPQRFGNLAFRTWGKKLEDNAKDLMKSLLPDYLHGSIHLLVPYFVISFGSFTRMDYGTGHEVAFGLFLLCLTHVRFFVPSPEEERNLVLLVFYRYLRLCWRLQDVYRLEPAGSHGVWGLDDYSFLGYIFGSAQLRDQKEIPVDAILKQPLPPTNLYFLLISRIHMVKSGPFFEHSSQLYAIATGVPNWGKVHSGLFKMYEAEVLGKRVVVQHIPVGGLVEWDPVRAPASMSPNAIPVNSTQNASTRAPWSSPAAQSNPSSVSSQLQTGAPWASNSSETRENLAGWTESLIRAPWKAGNSGSPRR